MRPVLVTKPAKLPVALSECKAAARIQQDIEDPLIVGWIESATNEAEEKTGKKLITQTWDVYFDDWPKCMDTRGEYSLELPYGPLQSVTSVQYVDPVAPTGPLLTWSSADYWVDAVSSRPRVVRRPTASFPAVYDQSNAVVVRCVVGYGDRPDQVPQKFRDWIMMQVATRYEYRESLSDRSVTELPRDFVHGLLDNFEDRRLP